MSVREKIKLKSVSLFLSFLVKAIIPYRGGLNEPDMTWRKKINS
jgi:hypothetical protein